MEEKKQIKLNLKVAIILVIAVLIIATIVGIIIATRKKKVKIIEEREFTYKVTAYSIGFLGTNRSKCTEYKLFNNYNEYQNYVNSINSHMEEEIDKYYLESFQLNDYSRYERIKDDEKRLKKEIESYKEFYNSDKAEKVIQEQIEELKKYLEDGGYTEKFFDEYSLLLVENSTWGKILDCIEVKGIYIEDNSLNVYINKDASGVVGNDESTIFFITLKKDDIKNIEKVDVKLKLKNTFSFSSGDDLKPIIYLYPTEETEISVKLINKDKIIVSYPKYTDGWNVIAKPDGTLVDLTTDRELYALYYENENVKPFKIEKDGFIVKGEDTIKFLEEKLAILGLNEREAEEFIVYWLPILESKEYNYIRFATKEEINANMPLEISPKPDTTIRILMSYKGLNEPIEVEEQKLETPERQGFVAVEWGGTEIK